MQEFLRVFVENVEKSRCLDLLNRKWPSIQDFGETRIRHACVTDASMTSFST